MTDLTFKHAPEVTLVDHQGSDASVVAAARVSVVGSQATTDVDASEHAGLINYLMKHRHGTPFEHNSLTFRVSAPIFVFREWHRHRIWSYNEESGRYKQLEPVFHIPGPERPLVNVGTSARPQMAPGTPEQYAMQAKRMRRSYGLSYAYYQQALDDGVAKEVAREVLPVGIYSTMYATANLRAVFAFLSLRTHDEGATFVSYPQYEIELAAAQVEKLVSVIFPISYQAFMANGRVAP